MQHSGSEELQVVKIGGLRVRQLLRGCMGSSGLMFFCVELGVAGLGCALQAKPWTHRLARCGLPQTNPSLGVLMASTPLASLAALEGAPTDCTAPQERRPAPRQR